MKNLENEIAKLNADLANLPREVKETFRRSIGELPAVFVIGKDCRVSYRFLDVNYANRLSIDELRRKL